MKSRFKVFILSFVTSIASAATWQSPPQKTLNVKLGIVVPSLGTEFKPAEDGAAKPVSYQPSGTSRTAMALGYGPFGLTASIRNPIDAEERRTRGETSVDDWQLRFYGKYGIWELFYQNYMGFFVENSAEIDPSLGENDPKIQRPDFRSVHYGLQYFRNLSPDEYSMGAAFDHGVYQTKSGGSWILTGTISRHRLAADSSLIPAQVTTSYTDLDGFKDGEFLGARVGGGYGYNFVWAPYYIGLMGTLSYGPQQQRYTLANEYVERGSFFGGGSLKAAIGANGPGSFWGLQMSYDLTTIQIKQSNIGLSTAEAMLFWGFRWKGVSLPPLDALSRALF